MIFKTNEEFSAFVIKQVKLSGMSQTAIADSLGVSRSNVNHALNKKMAHDTGRNGTRTRMLELFGYKVTKLLKVTKNESKDV